MSSEMKPVKGGFLGGGTEHPPEPENLQCPRCESTNTKFCYYNNYNLSQPRYFCKSCRRYWTRGGSLRNVPVGGGSRKNSKRLRPSLSSSATSSPLPPPLSAEIKTEPTPAQTLPPPPSTLSPFRCEMNLNEALPGSFSSLLCAGGSLGLGGYGIGLGSEPGPGHHTPSGFDMSGLGFGKDWPAIVTGGGGLTGGSSSGCNTWLLETGALTDGADCFGWPDLAISTPGTAGLE